MSGNQKEKDPDKQSTGGEEEDLVSGTGAVALTTLSFSQ